MATDVRFVRYHFLCCWSRDGASCMYFVIVAGLPESNESYTSMIDTNSAKSAHEIAVSEYRRKNDIPSNIQVRSFTLFRSDNMAEATLFFSKLQTKIEEAEDERSAS